ncbi:MAG: hypothetical protein P4L50_18075 [Anaerolineaceae bacterium]|nr:hypothetical protein [Anaerolineaceae bacterium]
MKYRNLGILLLAIWLILSGLLPLVKISLTGIGIILAVLALAAGILLLLEKRRGSIRKFPGTLLLSIFLIVTGLLGLVSLNIPGAGILLALLAIAAGVMLFLENRRGAFGRDLGKLLLEIWLVLDGLVALILTFSGAGTILAILALASGMLLLARR